MTTITMAKGSRRRELPETSKSTRAILERDGWSVVSVSASAEAAADTPIDEEFGFLPAAAAAALREAGYESLTAVLESSDEELLALHGFGDKSLTLVREAERRRTAR
jgi:hypothetical protein